MDHRILLLGLTLSLLLSDSPSSSRPGSIPPSAIQVNLINLATFLGLSATLLAVLQYAPQIYKTYRSKLVGALSVGTMVIQVPGSVLFVASIALREGTDWTSWLAYAVTGGMQGCLLVSEVCQSLSGNLSSRCTPWYCGWSSVMHLDGRSAADD